MTTRRTRIGIADVAEAAGVSKTAVSFAFNSPRRLSEETAARIRVVADELGYRPDPVARMLTSGETRTIGVLTPQPLAVSISNPFFGALSEGIAAVAEASDYGLNLISPLGGSLARAVSRATVDGIVAIGLSEDHPEIEQIRRTHLPIVLVDSTAMADQPSVSIDDQAGARMAAEHLVGLGHRDFLVISIVEAGSSARTVPGDRLAGYRSALSESGIELGDDRVETDTSTVAGGAQAFGRAWARGLRPTAVLAMSDAMAMGVIRAAAERGVGVPADMSVVGFDDVDVSAYINPPLTTIHQPIRRKGEEAVRLLLSAIERRAPGRDHLRLETHLVIRASTGPAPASNGR
jgi:DNA-binding LacI/PurR family transcriptional regulator